MIRELFLGFIRVHILFHAADTPVFGVALIAELGRHGYQIGPGTLYPILHGLARDGYLHQEGEVVNGKVRKYYRITPAGRRILARAQTQLHELMDEVLPGGGSKKPMKRLGTRSKTRKDRAGQAQGSPPPRTSRQGA